jgi:hypothetical protein
MFGMSGVAVVAPGVPVGVPVGRLVGVASLVAVGVVVGRAVVAVGGFGVVEGDGGVAGAAAVPVGVPGPESNEEGMAVIAVVAVGSAVAGDCAVGSGVPPLPGASRPFAPEGGTVVGGEAGTVAGAGGGVLVPLAATAGAAHIMPINRRQPIPARPINRRICRDTSQWRVPPFPMRAATRLMPSPSPICPTQPTDQLSLILAGCRVIHAKCGNECVRSSSASV